jgi:molybdopterin molybdotransferase
VKALDEALAEVLGSFGALPDPEEEVPLAEAQGRVLASEVHARVDQPAADTSAMDGWAIAFGSADERWRIAEGESRAGGEPPGPLEAGAALRIFTGAVLPAGADTVVLQEDAEREGDHVRFTDAPQRGRHVRRRASDVAAGERLLQRGVTLSPGAIALLASQGMSRVAVSRRPRVAIVPTGDELKAPGESDAPGAIVDSNGPMLEALVRRAGALPDRRPAAPDDLAALTEAFAAAIAESDLLLTTGGVSVGEHDHVKAAFERAGVSLSLWKVAMKPGKPLVFGRHESGTAVLGLPGNPVSALATFTLFAAPAIRILLGDPHPSPARLRARLTAPLRHRPGRTELARASLHRDEDGWVVTPHANQGSGALVAIGQSDTLVVIPAASTGLEAGALVEALPLAALPGEPYDRPLDT